MVEKTTSATLNVQNENRVSMFALFIKGGKILSLKFDLLCPIKNYMAFNTLCECFVCFFKLLVCSSERTC